MIEQALHHAAPVLLSLIFVTAVIMLTMWSDSDVYHLKR